jgi:hypothetical protein
MGLNIARQPAQPGQNDEAAALLNSFYKLRSEGGVIYGFWTNKIMKEIDELISACKLVESYDLEQLIAAAGKDVREHYLKYPAKL